MSTRERQRRLGEPYYQGLRPPVSAAIETSDDTIANSRVRELNT